MENKLRQFRDALGMFATGVTVVTTVNGNGKAVAMTANSFASLSLDPPLILWNAGDKSDCFDAFAQTEHFCVHILHEEQEDISRHFATKSEDKFSDVEWSTGLLGSPVLSDYAVCLECSREASYPGGDHMIMVGRVVNYHDRGDVQPLLFHRGQYKKIV